MVQEAYCSHEVAKLLKEKGFHEKVRYEYHHRFTTPNFHRHLRDFNGQEYEGLNTEWCSAPTHQMAMAWVRGKGFSIEPYAAAYRYGFVICRVPTGSFVCNESDVFKDGADFEEHWEAVEAALKYTLENLI